MKESYHNKCMIKCVVSMFVVTKGIHLVVVVCLVHNNGHPSLVCGQYDYLLVGFQSFQCSVLVRSQVPVR